jgi:hypothetical protein
MCLPAQLPARCGVPFLCPQIFRGTFSGRTKTPSAPATQALASPPRPLSVQDAWEDLVSRLPREAAITLLRDSCLGKQVLQESLMRAAIRRTASAPLPPAPAEEDLIEELDNLLRPGRCQST